ncbi:MAG: CCR4-NOT regulatory complex component [Phylliscum demangeonii]|nr:MAG: CCR4-NOT regulatory complex component [Phylliscum demangeonii]
MDSTPPQPPPVGSRPAATTPPTIPPTIAAAAFQQDKDHAAAAAAAAAAATADEAPHLPAHPPTIDVQHLHYRFPDGSLGLSDVTLSLPAGSRTVVIGANGAGKSSLLRVLSGRRLATRRPTTRLQIAGADPFETLMPSTVYLGAEWLEGGNGAVVRAQNMAVGTLLASIGGDAFPARRDALLRVLDVDLSWRLHALSDGQRRRVQLVLGLVRPWAVLLLDEVTLDLDVRARRRLLEYLREETEGERATVLYATHVLDGLRPWITHVLHMARGRVCHVGTAESFFGGGEGAGGGGGGGAGGDPLADLALAWLEDDYRERGGRPEEEACGAEVATAGLGGYGYEPRRKSRDG